jgi:hypothetical protein
MVREGRQAYIDKLRKKDEMEYATGPENTRSSRQKKAELRPKVLAGTRLFFRENEINQMQQGPANFPSSRMSTTEYLAQLQWCPPEWQTLKGPFNRWGLKQPYSRPECFDQKIEGGVVHGIYKNPAEKTEIDRLIEQEERQKKRKLTQTGTQGPSWNVKIKTEQSGSKRQKTPTGYRSKSQEPSPERVATQRSVDQAGAPENGAT